MPYADLNLDLMKGNPVKNDLKTELVEFIAKEIHKHLSDNTEFNMTDSTLDFIKNKLTHQRREIAERLRKHLERRRELISKFGNKYEWHMDASKLFELITDLEKDEG